MRLEPAVPQGALAAIRAPFAQAGATPVDVAVLLPLALLLDLSGEAMRPRLFVVQAEGGEELALRPDFTIPVARAHIDSGAAEGRYAYEGKAFRAAPAGSQRAEEFLQIGVELFGNGDPAVSDAEVATLAWQSAAAGGRDDLTLTFGDIALFGAFVDSLALAPALAARLKRLFTRPRLLAAELDRADAGVTVERIVNPLEGVPEGQGPEALRQLWAIAGIEPVGTRPPEEIVRRLADRAEASRTPSLSPAEAAAVRGFLAVSGSLNLRTGGPSVMVPIDAGLTQLLYNPAQWVAAKDSSEHQRRSVYLFAKRNLRLPFMEAFDAPDLQASCARRESSTHAPQALELLNGAFTNAQAEALARRLERQAGSNPRRQVELGYRLVAGRPPRAAEMTAALEFLKTQPRREFALALLNLNAFLYIN